LQLVLLLRQRHGCGAALLQAVLKRKTEEAEAARKRIRELLELQQRKRVQRNESTVNVECQPNAGAPLLRSEPARREWLEQELDMCNTSWEYQKVGEGVEGRRLSGGASGAELSASLMALQQASMMPMGITVGELCIA
jgi:kinesin family protein 4/21/27